MKTVAIIPARYDSSRFPGKPLRTILDKPMIQWVYDGIKSCELIDEIYVATDDSRIFDTVIDFGGNPIMTKSCNCGTDRIYEASKTIDCDIVLNVQGDEPLITHEAIKDLISAFEDKTTYAAILKKKLPKSEIHNPNICKVVTDKDDNALLFSRSAIPYDRDHSEECTYYQAMGVYGFTKDFLEIFANLPTSLLESTEKIEQLRILENGYKIKVIESNYDGIGVDTPDDLARVEAIIRNRSNHG